MFIILADHIYVVDKTVWYHQLLLKISSTDTFCHRKHSSNIPELPFTMIYYVYSEIIIKTCPFKRPKKTLLKRLQRVAIIQTYFFFIFCSYDRHHNTFLCWRGQIFIVWYVCDKTKNNVNVNSFVVSTLYPDYLLWFTDNRSIYICCCRRHLFKDVFGRK